MKKGGFNKRSGFKSIKKDGFKKVNQPLYKKKRGTNKKRKTPRQKEIDKCDRAFSQYIRLRYCDYLGMVKCYTCDTIRFWKNSGMQCGHFKSRVHLNTRWRVINARPQCPKCNGALNGNLEEYAKRLSLDHGEEILEVVDTMSKKVTKLSTNEIKSIRLKLERKVKELRENKNL